MKKQVVGKEIEKKTILYCRSAGGDNTELQKQKDILDDYAKENGLVVVFALT